LYLQWRIQRFFLRHNPIKIICLTKLKKGEIETTPVKYEIDKSKNHENTNQHEHHKNIRKQTSTNTFTIYVKLEINYINSTCMLPNWVNHCTESHNNVVLPPILQRSIHIKGQRDGNYDMYITYWILYFKLDVDRKCVGRCLFSNVFVMFVLIGVFVIFGLVDFIFHRGCLDCHSPLSFLYIFYILILAYAI
jgi:hypothetical protein